MAKLRPAVPTGMSMPELALRHILQHPAVSTVIPGMRKMAHVRSNMTASDAPALPDEALAELRRHRWDRKPTVWSQ